MEGIHGLKMSEQEIQEYMQGVVQGKLDVTGMEATILEEWKGATQALNKAQEGVNKAKAEVERLSNVVQQLHGARQAHLSLLIAAEEGRRNAGNPKLGLVPNQPKAKKE